MICLHWWALAPLAFFALLGVFFVAFVVHTWCEFH